MSHYSGNAQIQHFKYLIKPHSVTDIIDVQVSEKCHVNMINKFLCYHMVTIQFSDKTKIEDVQTSNVIVELYYWLKQSNDLILFKLFSHLRKSGQKYANRLAEEKQLEDEKRKQRVVWRETEDERTKRDAEQRAQRQQEQRDRAKRYREECIQKMLDQFEVEYKKTLNMDITKITDLKLSDKCQILYVYNGPYAENSKGEQIEYVEECLHHIMVTYEDDTTEEAIISSDIIRKILDYLDLPYPEHFDTYDYSFDASDHPHESTMARFHRLAGGSNDSSDESLESGFGLFD